MHYQEAHSVDNHDWGGRRDGTFRVSASVYNFIGASLAIVSPPSMPLASGLNPRVAEVTARIIARSAEGRSAWLERMTAARSAKLRNARC